MTMMTQVEFARSLGKSKQYINKLVRTGKISLGPDGLIDPEAATAALKKSADPARKIVTSSGTPSPSSPSENGEGYYDARTKRESIRAKVEELKYRRTSGELVDVAEIESELKGVFRDLRDRLQALPTTWKGRLVSMTDEREIQIYLSEQIRLVLEDISDRASERINYARARI